MYTGYTKHWRVTCDLRVENPCFNMTMLKMTTLQLVTGREARIFRNLLATIAKRFLIGTTEQASLMAKFRLMAVQWL
jgi:hypothetical protein